MSTVWIVNHYAVDPGVAASGSRHFSLSKRLAELGWTPVVIAATSGHNSPGQHLSNREPWVQSDREGMTFRWLRTSEYAGNGLGRVVNILQFTVALLRRRSTRGLPAPDIIVGSTVHPLAAWAASVVAKRLGVPFVFEIRDLWPQTLIDMGKISANGPVALFLRALEKHLCNRAASIITLLPRASDYLQSVGVDPAKVIWISNGTDARQFASAPPVPSGPFTFGYFGSLGYANGMTNIVRGFGSFLAQTEVADCRLSIVGSGPQRSQLESLADELGLAAHVDFQDAVPKDQIPAVATRSHALVLNLLDLKIYRYGISLNKLFDYMAAGRPILFAGNPVNNPVQDADGGICVGADDPTEIARGMMQMWNASTEQRETWGANAAVHVAENYDYRVLGDKLDRVLGAIVSDAARDSGHGLDRSS